MAGRVFSPETAVINKYRRCGHHILWASADRAAQKVKYRGEIFPSDQPVGNYGENSFEFFQTDRDQNRKGIIAIDLLRWEP